MCKRKFAGCNYVIDDVLRTCKVSFSIGYKVNKPSRVLCNNKVVILSACGMNIIIKKV